MRSCRVQSELGERSAIGPHMHTGHGAPTGEAVSRTSGAVAAWGNSSWGACMGPTQGSPTLPRACAYGLMGRGEICINFRAFRGLQGIHGAPWACRKFQSRYQFQYNASLKSRRNQWHTGHCPKQCCQKPTINAKTRSDSPYLGDGRRSRGFLRLA